MTTIYNYGNDTIDKMYKIFRKAVEKSGLFGELRKNCLLYTSDAADE